MSLEKSNSLVPIITKIDYQFAKNVLSVTKGSDNFSVVVDLTGNDWLPIYFTPGTAKFKEPSKRTTAGVEYKQQLSFNFPGENSLFHGDIEKMERLPVVARLTYSDGTIKLMGTKSIPANFLSDYVSDADASQSDFVFACNTNHRAYSLE